MDLSFLERIALKYLEAHPEIIERLIASLIDKVLTRLENKA